MERNSLRNKSQIPVSEAEVGESIVLITTRDLSTGFLVRGFSSSSEEKPLQFVGIFVFGFGCGRFKRAAERGSGGPDPLVLGGPSYRK